MNYRVFWFPEADRFLDVLRASESGDKIAAAAKEIDRQLSTDPFGFGESRYGQVRIGFEGPLAVYFEILRDVSTVIVFNVGRTDRKRG